MSDSKTGPLSGVQVIDLTIWIQGPLSGALLADLGADVIKVETADGGDFSRNLLVTSPAAGGSVDAASMLWALCNRNKRAITLDLHKEAARPIFRRLVEQADVLVTNLHPDTLDRFEVDEASIRRLNPRIVYARAAGFGQDGPWARDPCQDTVGMAYSGFMYTSSSSNDVPYYPPGSLSDVISGTTLAFGILAALMERTRTGEGQSVSASQLQSMMWIQLQNLATVATLGRPVKAFDRTGPRNPVFNVFPCGDGTWIAIAVLLDKHWPVFCEAVGLEHLCKDAHFADAKSRRENAAELVRLVETRLATAPRGHWVEQIRARGLWVAPVNRLEDLVDDEQVRANGYLTELDDGWVMPNMPFTLKGYEPGRRAAPGYGADTETVLKEIGLSDEEILALRIDGAIF